MTFLDPLEAIKKDTVQVNSSSQGALTEEFTDKEKRDYDSEEKDQVLQLRKDYAPKFWKLTYWSLILVGFYLIFSTFSEINLWGYVFSFKVFSPSDSVLIALLSTTTANIIAILIVFARFIFPDGGLKKDK